jgi:hypothetical protein
MITLAPPSPDPRDICIDCLTETVVIVSITTEGSLLCECTECGRREWQ